MSFVKLNKRLTNVYRRDHDHTKFEWETDWTKLFDEVY